MCWFSWKNTPSKSDDSDVRTEDAEKIRRDEIAKKNVQNQCIELCYYQCWGCCYVCLCCELFDS